MSGCRVLCRFMVAVILLAVSATGCAQAQSGKPDFQPQVGQEGKDVIWVPWTSARVTAAR
jgi:hypothetical protein